MSQHRFESVSPTGDSFFVTIGYDRRLHYVHCVVENAAQNVLYSNLDDNNAGTTLRDVRYYEGVLESLGITLPEVIYKNVESDQLLRVGNRLVIYNQDGSTISDSGTHMSEVPNYHAAVNEERRQSLLRTLREHRKQSQQES